MAISVVSPHFMFGATVSTCKNAIDFINNSTVIYPAGASLVLYDMDQRSQNLIIGHSRARPLTALAVTPNRRYIAVAELADSSDPDNTTDFQPIVTVYDTQLYRKRKILSTPHVHSAAYVSLSFSPDSKYLLTLGGGPEWTLVYWSWEQSRVLATVNCANPLTDGRVEEISYCPLNSDIVCVVGYGVFRIYRYFRGSMKSIGLQRFEYPNLTCHAWLANDQIICGTYDGRVVLYGAPNGETKKEHVIMKQASIVEIKGQSSEEGGSMMSVNLKLKPSSVRKLPNNAVGAIVTYSRGFACACGLGVVHIFDKSEDSQEYFRFLRRVSILQDQNSYVPETSCLQLISSLSMNPSEETLVCATSSNQLYSFYMGHLEDLKELEFDVLSTSFHSAPITGMDVCLRKQYFATCSKDKTVSIWDYDNCNQVLHKQFSEECYSIAIHPEGHYVVVGFPLRLRFMYILIDDIRTFCEFEIRNCPECRFSYGGHRLAAVNGNIIQVYSTLTFDNICNLKGHGNRVQSLMWSDDDSTMVTCGTDGAVYQWDLSIAERVEEHVYKQCSYNCVTISKDKRSTFAVGSDSTLKEIVDSQVVRVVQIPHTILKYILLSHSGRQLFTGTITGGLRSMKFPLTVPGEWAEYTAHAGMITGMRMSYDNKYVLTASEDGCVVLWLVHGMEGRGAYNRHFTFTGEVLITRSDLKEKNTIIAELKSRIQEMKLEYAYLQKLCEQNNRDLLKELTEKFELQLEAEKEIASNLNVQLDEQESKFQQHLKDVAEKHVKEVEHIELMQGMKIMMEYEKYNELTVKLNHMSDDYEQQIRALLKKNAEGSQSLVHHYETMLQDLSEKNDLCTTGLRQHIKESDETIRQTEDDGDHELITQRHKFEKLIVTEQDTIEELMTRINIDQKKLEMMLADLNRNKERLEKSNSQIKLLDVRLLNQEKDIVALKKEITDRDDTIQHKEKRTYELKKKNQELEKFRFVLDYKIKELEKKLEPKEKELKEMKVQISEMEVELDTFHTTNKILSFRCDDEHQKLKAMEHEMIRERTKARDLASNLKRIQNDIYRCANLIQEPAAFKADFLAILRTHVQDDFNPEMSTIDSEIQKEHNMQRQHLEKSVTRLMRRMAADNAHSKDDNVHIMQDNVIVLRELNDLRRELKDVRVQLRNIESAMGLHRKTNKMSPAELLTMIGDSTKNAQMERELIERQRAAALQTYELLKARNELCSIEKRAADIEATRLTHRFASANDAGFWPHTPGDPEFQFPPIKGVY